MRIATVYSAENFDDFKPSRMSVLRWLRMSEALARAGHRVDMIVNTPQGVVQRQERLCFVPMSEARWDEYDLLKLTGQRGFDAIRSDGVEEHPFILCSLGNVVGDRDGTAGVHYAGEERAVLWELQRQIRETARLVAVCTENERRLWEDLFGTDPAVVVVPTGVDTVIPSPRRNPYASFPEKIAVYIGNLRGRSGGYRLNSDPVNLVGELETNDLLQERLNRLGRRLKTRGIRLCVIGPGRTTHLDSTAVTYLGVVDSDSVWDYQYFADVGIALAFGPRQLYEASKIYNYLRAGLPVVSERPIPNNDLVRETALGLIADYRDDQMMAELIEAAVSRSWDTEHASRVLLRSHTWDHRVARYGSCPQWPSD